MTYPYVWPISSPQLSTSIDSSDPSTWPYDRMRDALVDGTDIWIETTSATYWQQVGVVPPIDRQSGCFLVGEPYCDTMLGVAFAAFVEFDDRFFCRIVPRVYFGHEVDRLKLALWKDRQTSPNIAKDPQRSTWHAELRTATEFLDAQSATVSIELLIRYRGIGKPGSRNFYNFSDCIGLGPASLLYQNVQAAINKPQHDAGMAEYGLRAEMLS